MIIIVEKSGGEEEEEEEERGWGRGNGKEKLGKSKASEARNERGLAGRRQTGGLACRWLIISEVVGVRQIHSKTGE